ncbi:MAG: hypothetical protein Q9161_002125 [Pseudevernia consocians]
MRFAYEQASAVPAEFPKKYLRKTMKTKSEVQGATEEELAPVPSALKIANGDFIDWLQLINTSDLLSPSLPIGLGGPIVVEMPCHGGEEGHNLMISRMSTLKSKVAQKLALYGELANGLRTLSPSLLDLV